MALPFRLQGQAFLPAGAFAAAALAAGEIARPARQGNRAARAETAVDCRLRAGEDHRPLRKGGGSLQALRQPQCFPAGRTPAQGTISGSYTGAARRGASETPPAGGSDLIGPETPRLPEGLAAGVNARPTIPRKWVPGKETSTAKAKFPVSPAVCLAL